VTAEEPCSGIQRDLGILHALLQPAKKLIKYTDARTKVQYGGVIKFNFYPL
jgi:hypothetical protein